MPRPVKLLLQLSQASLIMASTWVPKLPAAENKWMWVSCELRLSLDKDVMDGLRPPTTWHRGATSTALKPGEIMQQKHWTQWGSKNKKKAKLGADFHLMVKNWRGVCTNTGSYSFSNGILLHTKSFVLSQTCPLVFSIADRMTKLDNPDLRDAPSISL